MKTYSPKKYRPFAWLSVLLRSMTYLLRHWLLLLVAALVISSSGFFPDGKWHGLAEGLSVTYQGQYLGFTLGQDAVSPAAAAVATPSRMPSSGVRPQTLTACAVT